MNFFRVSIFLFAGAAMMGISAVAAAPAKNQAQPIAIVMHGGAGTITRGNMTPKLEARYRRKLKKALNAGYAVLKRGGKSVKAVQAAITVLEDSPLFNAGKGAVLTHNHEAELDSAIMDGKNLNAGAVAAVQHIKNPILAATLVMKKSRHVLLVAKGADEFAKQHGMQPVPNRYFHTQRREKQLQRALQSGGDKSAALPEQIAPRIFAYGTVGCAALDKQGNLAAGTSTGGLTDKKFGRVGDSPIIGDGTYANNRTLAASGTGIGEYYMRLNVLKDISDLMQYKGWSLQKAANYEVNQKLVRHFGKNTGGVIALDRQGNIAMPFNTPGMYRGYVNAKGKMVIKIYKNDSAL